MPPYIVYTHDVQEAGEHRSHDPVYLRHSVDGGRPIPTDSDGPDSPAEPLLARSVSVTLQNPQVAKAQQNFQGAFQAEVVKVSIFFQQEMSLSLIHISEPTRPY